MPPRRHRTEPPAAGAARTADFLSRLQAVTAAFSSALTPRQVAEVIFEEALKPLAPRSCVLANLAADGRLDLLFQHGLPKETAEKFRRFPADAPIPLADAFREQEALWLESPEAIDKRYPDLKATRLANGDGTWVAIPLIADKQSIGAVGLSFVGPRSFGAEERDFLVAVARQCAQALDRARLFDNEWEANARAAALNERLRAIHHVTEGALGRLDLDDLLREVLLRLRNVFASHTASVLLLSDDGKYLFVRASSGLDMQSQKDVRVPLGRGVAGRIAVSLKPAIVADLSREECLNPVLRANVRSLIAAPLIVGDRLIGVIHLGTMLPREFTEDDLRVLEMVSGAVAPAIETARLHEQTRFERARWQATAEGIALALVVYGPDGSIQHMNPRAKTILGSAEGAPRFETADGRPIPPDGAPVALALRGETVRGTIMVLRRPDSKIWLSCSAAPIGLSGGGPLGAVVTFTDITALRELEEQRENLLRAVSHDIRNPLTAILLNAQMLERSTSRSGTETDRRNATVIVSAVQRLDAMIQELVDSSRLHDGRMTLKKRPLDLRSLFSDLLPRASGTIDPARVAADIPSSPLPVDADPAQIERVIVNLLGNSSKYAAEGTRVRLRLEAREREALVSLKDEGPGISSKDLPHIFDRFFRAGNAEEKEGLGLGLYISKKLIENHGGKMWAESEPGQGSTFFFSLPLSAGA